MELLFIVIILGLLPAWIAQRKGHNFWAWWLFGAALFIVALPAALLIKPNEQTRRPCPSCRTSIDAQARVCPQCGRDVFETLAATP